MGLHHSQNATGALISNWHVSYVVSLCVTKLRIISWMPHLKITDLCSWLHGCKLQVNSKVLIMSGTYIHSWLPTLINLVYKTHPEYYVHGIRCMPPIYLWKSAFLKFRGGSGNLKMVRPLTNNGFNGGA